MTTIPRPQPLVALDLANEIRFARARVKRDLRAGTLTVAEALDLACCQRMLVADLLTAQRNWGPHRARKLLRRAGVPEHARVAGLTVRQRAALIELTDVAGRVA